MPKAGNEKMPSETEDSDVRVKLSTDGFSVDGRWPGFAGNTDTNRRSLLQNLRYQTVKGRSLEPLSKDLYCGAIFLLAKFCAAHIFNLERSGWLLSRLEQTDDQVL
jgi:hypothetical protein